TEQDFRATLGACASAGFSKIHIFPYSPRRGTPAAAMPGAVSPDVVRERRTRLAALESELAARYYQSLVGRWLEVLVERTSDEWGARGTACRYVPVRFAAGHGEIGKLVTLRAVEATQTYVAGERRDAGPRQSVFNAHPLPILNPFCGGEDFTPATFPPGALMSQAHHHRHRVSK